MKLESTAAGSKPGGPTNAPPRAQFEVSLATLSDREVIGRLRHDVYALELGQHPANSECRLRDALDDHNDFLVVKEHDMIVGFVSITPPSAPRFSIDKYFGREQLPFQPGDTTYEVRLLTVVKDQRGREISSLIMYAALRWVEAAGGKDVIGMGRSEIMSLYERCGMRATGQRVRSGQVTYELMHASVAELRRCCESFGGLLDRLEDRSAWLLPFEFRRPSACFHGGAFFSAIGEDFGDLGRRHEIINADVLDAWFPPAPRVIQSLEADLPWLLRTSPPNDCGGLKNEIAKARGVRPINILPGAGSSDLIFRALGEWLDGESNVLILYPTYGEYAHVLEGVIGCTVDRLTLSPSEEFVVDPDRLLAAMQDQYDLVVLVNPNSPTGQHVPRRVLESIIRQAPSATRFWIDETYVEYAGSDESMERFAAASRNVVVCKSMSKAYGLSGARVAYLCAGAHQLESLRAKTPPWVVGLPSQVAAVRALQSPAYYAQKYAETDCLREQLSRDLQKLGWKVYRGIANFLLCELPADELDAESLAVACRQHGLFLRAAFMTGTEIGGRLIRLAVKDPTTNQRMVEILKQVCARYS